MTHGEFLEENASSRFGFGARFGLVWTLKNKKDNKHLALTATTKVYPHSLVPNFISLSLSLSTQLVLNLLQKVLSFYVLSASKLPLSSYAMIQIQEEDQNTPP